MRNRTFPKWTLHLLILAWPALLAANDQPPQEKPAFSIVGYLPDYRIAKIDPAVGRHLTDVVFFSVRPEPTGKFVSPTLQSPKTVELLNTLRNEHRVNILLCVGGWDRSQGFAEIASQAKSRATFAEGLTAFCLKHHFAGADIDWEHPENASQVTDYGLLLSEIAGAFRPHKLRLTAAIAGWQSLTPAGITALDGIHLMSYDADGKHSTLEQAQADVKKLLDAGVPLQKIRLGVPFYGRGIKQRDLTKTYAEIASSGKAETIDEIDDIYFNGPATIRAKTRFARDKNLGGIMIWEIGQDAPGNASLIRVIHEEVNQPLKP